MKHILCLFTLLGASLPTFATTCHPIRIQCDDRPCRIRVDTASQEARLTPWETSCWLSDSIRMELQPTSALYRTQDLKIGLAEDSTTIAVPSLPLQTPFATPLLWNRKSSWSATLLFSSSPSLSLERAATSRLLWSSNIMYHPFAWQQRLVYKPWSWPWSWWLGLENEYSQGARLLLGTAAAFAWEHAWLRFDITGVSHTRQSVAIWAAPGPEGFCELRVGPAWQNLRPGLLLGIQQAWQRVEEHWKPIPFKWLTGMEFTVGLGSSGTMALQAQYPWKAQLAFQWNTPPTPTITHTAPELHAHQSPPPTLWLADLNAQGPTPWPINPIQAHRRLPRLSEWQAWLQGQPDSAHCRAPRGEWLLPDSASTLRLRSGIPARAATDTCVQYPEEWEVVPANDTSMGRIRWRQRVGD